MKETEETASIVVGFDSVAVPTGLYCFLMADAELDVAGRSALDCVPFYLGS